MSINKKSLVVIVGPTAVGKTSLAIHVAQKLHAEIVSADSRQIFKEMNIGTAKPTTEELAVVPHYFINSHSINEDYDAAQYGEEALACIRKLFEHSDTVVLCGGSGLYVKALLEGFDDIPEVEASIREEISRRYQHEGLSWLQSELKSLDPEIYEQIDVQNPHRLIRALEVRMQTGVSISSFRKKVKRKLNFNVIKIGLELPREELYHRIDRRMDQMIADGLFEEAQSLYPLKSLRALQTVGYQEIFDYIDNQYDREEAIRLLKRNSRHYAKRQMTWFKKDPEIRWFNAKDEQKIFDYIADQMNASR